MRHGSRIDPPNRFESIHRESDLEDALWDEEAVRDVSDRKIEYVFDESRSIVAENKSPDLPFRFSLNPYRGCIHGCSYCYARPTHEYLGFNAGLDFETKIVVKSGAPKLFEEFLARPSWQPEPIAFSGVTDCYQPAERKFRLTRGCLEVAESFQQPLNIVTKNALVARDIDLLSRLAERRLAHVFVSVTTLDDDLARVMEPRTSTPRARLRAIRELTEAGVQVGVMVAPLIPGMNDHEVPEILAQAKAHGAEAAGYVLLRLPRTVRVVFEEWLQRERPDLAEKVLGRVRQTRGGQMNDSSFGSRMTGTGEIAEQIRSVFHVFRAKQGLTAKLDRLDCDRFRRPEKSGGQMRLFE